MDHEFDWTTWPWNQCKARLPKADRNNYSGCYGRCDLKKGHNGDHCLERGIAGDILFPNFDIVEYIVTLHAAGGVLAGCGLSLHTCYICKALVVEDFMEEHVNSHKGRIRRWLHL